MSLNFAWNSVFVLKLLKVRFSSMNFEKVRFYTWISFLNFFLKWWNSYIKKNFFQNLRTKNEFFEIQRQKTNFIQNLGMKSWKQYFCQYSFIERERLCCWNMKKRKQDIKLVLEVAFTRAHIWHLSSIIFSSNLIWEQVPNPTSTFASSFSFLIQPWYVLSKSWAIYGPGLL